MIVNRMPVLAIWIALVASLGTGVTVSLSATAIQGTASVIDGDTIEIRGQCIRLDAIDAPESSQLCLDAAGKRYRCDPKLAITFEDVIGGSVVTWDSTPQNTELRFANSSIRSRTQSSQII